MKAFKNLKIGRKMTAAFAIIILLFAANMLVYLFGVNTISHNMNEFYENQFQVVMQSQTTKTDLQSMAKGLARVGMLSAVSQGVADTQEEQELWDTKVKEAQTYINNLSRDIELLDQYTLTEQAELDNIKELYKTLTELTPVLFGYYENQQIKEGSSLAFGEYDKTGVAIGVSLEKIVQTAQKEAVAKYEHNQRLLTDLHTATMILSAVLLAVCIVLSITLTRSITKPVEEMEIAARRLSQGQLNQQITYESKDEVGSLADSLRDTIDSVRQYIGEIDTFMEAVGTGRLNFKTRIEFKGDFVSIKQSIDKISANLTQAMIQINTSAEQVMRGAEQIAGSGQALSQATLEQASSVEELGTTINDISERVNETAVNAVETSRLTEAVSMQMEESGVQMKNLSDSLKDMRNMSSDITGIVKDIEDIAFQTNILSLNASVEAARAGEAGKGFSVVANEIRRLSAKTTEASKTTANLIKQTLRMMADSEDLSEETSSRLKNLQLSTKNAAEKVNIISRAANEQATAIVQIRQSIEQISDIVQENSATAEESAASSEELTGQMKMLKSLVDTFEYDEK